MQKSTLVRGAANLFTFVEDDGTRRRSATIAGLNIARSVMLDQRVIDTLASLKAGEPRKTQGDAKGVVLPLGDVEADVVVEETTTPARRDALGNLVAEASTVRVITELRSVKRVNIDYGKVDAAFGDIDALLA